MQRLADEGVPGRSWIYAGGVATAVALGAALRLWFRVGFVGGFPQDDGIYVNLARMLAGGQDITARYIGFDATRLANPAELFAFRTAFIYPLSWAFRLFGEGDGPATLFGIGCALVSIVAVAEIARLTTSPAAGIAAALLLALLPHDVLITTRVLSDGPLRMFVALACLLMLRGSRFGADAAFGGAGAMLGLSYLVKIVGAPIFLLLAAVPALVSARRRTPRPLLWYGAGFAVVLACETAWYLWRTGHWFLHYRVVASGVLFKLKFEPPSYADFGTHLRVLWEGEFLWYAPVVLGMTTVGMLAQSGFGVQGWIWLAGFLERLRAKSAEGRLLIVMALALYVFVEISPAHVQLDGGRLEYEMVYRQWRFASLLTPAWVPLGGGALAWLWSKSRIAVVAVALACVASGWPSLTRLYDTLHGSQADLRAAARFIAEHPARVYTDPLAHSTLHYYLGRHEATSRIADLATLGNMLPEKGDLVVTGGSRGIELVAEAWEKDLPLWCRAFLIAPEIPPGWKVVLRVPGPHYIMRLHDLLIVEFVGV